MDSLIEHCHAYRIQAEEYRSDCIEGVWILYVLVDYCICFIVQSYRLISHIIEFNSQLDTLMSLLVMVPPLVFTGVRLQHRDQAGRAREEQRNQHREEMEKSSREKVRELLLGHQTTVTVALSLPPVVP